MPQTITILDSYIYMEMEEEIFRSIFPLDLWLE